jgi:hypothetical protein
MGRIRNQFINEGLLLNGRINGVTTVLNPKYLDPITQKLLMILRKTNIKAIDLKKKIQEHKGKGILELNNFNVQGKLTIGKTDKIGAPITFNGCHFEHVVFNKADIRHELRFHFYSRIQKLVIKNSEFKKDIFFSNCKVKYSIESNNNKFKSIIFEQSDIDEGGFNLTECEMEKLQIGRVFSQGGVTLSNCKTFGSIRFLNFHTKGSIVFINGEHHKDIWLSLSKVPQGLIFNDGTFYKDFKVEGTDFSSNLTVIGADFHKELSFKMSSKIVEQKGNKKVNTIKKASPPKNIYIKESKFGGGFRYEASDGENSVIEKLDLKCSQSLSGEISFIYVNIKELFLTGANYNSRLIFNKLRVKNFNIHYFANYSNLQLHNVSQLDDESFFEVKNSVLGTSNFFNLNFRKFRKLIIKDSQLIGASFTHVLWPKNIFISQKDYNNYETRDFTKQKIVYQQLKQIMKGQGDIPTSLFFERKEWTAFRKFILKRDGWFKRFNDWFILWSNQSNDFGLNWLKPLVFLILTNLIFYALIVQCLNPLKNHGFFTHWYTDFFWQRFHMYWHFLNPAHNLKHFAEDMLQNNCAMFLNVLMRVSSAYFIFQMVKAFRKYTS